MFCHPLSTHQAHRTLNCPHPSLRSVFLLLLLHFRFSLWLIASGPLLWCLVLLPFFSFPLGGLTPCPVRIRRSTVGRCRHLFHTIPPVQSPQASPYRNLNPTHFLFDTRLFLKDPRHRNGDDTCTPLYPLDPPPSRRAWVVLPSLSPALLPSESPREGRRASLLAASIPSPRPMGFCCWTSHL